MDICMFITNYLLFSRDVKAYTNKILFVGDDVCLEHYTGLITCIIQIIKKQLK